MTRIYLDNALYLLVGLNFVAAAVESVGILLFIPFLSQLSGGLAAPPDRITASLYASFSFLNVEVTVEHTLLALVLAFTLKGAAIFCLNALRTLFVNGTRHRMRERLISLYAEVDYRYSMSRHSGFFGGFL